MVAVEAAIETIAPQARAKAIELELVSRTEGVLVLGDDARLQQVVWNLLTNAIKFTPSNGRVTVAATVDQGWFELRVIDTGKGISPEFLPRLFDRFSQQDVGTSKSFGGLGIGLTIVHHLVTQHHGAIEASSQGPATGATFKVRIPLTLEPKRTSQDPVAALAGVDVLVVEDIDDSRALIARLLADAGAQVRDAASGAAALQLVRAAKPDVLVSDIGMAGMDGYELMRSLRAAGYSAAMLPAIALTAFVRGEEISVAMGAGFQRHLGKPVNPQLLIETVAHLHAEARASTPEAPQR
jgi:CheY-like chemotaxis protein